MHRLLHCRVLFTSVVVLTCVQLHAWAEKPLADALHARNIERVPNYYYFPLDLAQKPTPAAMVDYSPDGKRLLIGRGSFNTGGDVFVWDLEQDKEVHRHWLGLGVRRVCYAPDGKTFAAACFDQCAKVFDAETGEQIAVLPVTRTNGVNAVAYSPDGSKLITVGLHHLVILWDMNTYQEIRRMDGHGRRIFCGAYAPDGKTIASVDGAGLIMVWDADTGKKKHEMRGHNGHIEVVDFTNDSKFVVTAGLDQTLRFWDVETGNEVQDLRVPTDGKNFGLGASPVDPIVVVGGEGDTLTHFNYETGKIQKIDAKNVTRIRGIRFSPDGKEFAAACQYGEMVRWDATTHEIIQKFNRQMDANDQLNTIMTMDMTGDERLLADGHANGEVRVRDVVTGEIVETIIAHDGQVASVRFSHDGKQLATCGCDHLVKLWDVTALSKDKVSAPIFVLKGHSEWVIGCDFSHDGKWLATGSVDRSVRVWDVASGREIEVLKEHESPVRGIAFSRDDKTLLTAETAGKVNRWSTSEWNAEPLARLTDVTAIKISPSGDMLAVASPTDGVGIYDTTDWTEIELLSEPKELTCIDWAPHGKWIAGGDAQGKFWNFSVDGTQRQRPHDGNNRKRAITSIAVGWDGDVIICAGLDGRLAKHIKLPVQRQPQPERED